MKSPNIEPTPTSKNPKMLSLPLITSLVDFFFLPRQELKLQNVKKIPESSRFQNPENNNACLSLPQLPIVQF
jgi:hypothetical protein